MRKTFGMNRHQKAAHKPGERKVSRAEIADLLELSCSAEVDDRLVAAQYLCPCHIQARLPAVWEAVFRMMEDVDRRVRFAAWHTWEDGGLPTDEEALTRMGQILDRERDPKVRRFAGQIMRPVLAARAERERALHRLAAQPRQQLGKCDFCGATAVPVTWALDTEIPSGDGGRAARICGECAQVG
ncbi:MAG: hypothetical protein KJZ93_01650 [Caldilineaceae bacterium]|nr:hypothetical protein [Caldilineaceae bacterium]